MIKEAMQYLVSQVENKIYEIDGRTYTQDSLTLVEEPRYRPSVIKVQGLESIVSLIYTEIDVLNAPLFVEVTGHKTVSVYSTYNNRFERQDLYHAVSDMPDFGFGWKEYQEAMISFRSQFIQDGDVSYILDLLSKISDENSVKTEDNGLSQSVQINKGVMLKGTAIVKPIVKLTPYRTFKELEQPESEFLLRLDEGGRVGLFEADGGMWKLEAKKRIADYFKKELAGFVDTNSVVVMY